MLEAIGLNLVATGLATGGSVGVEKARTFLRDNRYSDEVDPLTTEFTSALKDALETAIREEGRNELAEKVANWTTVAEELDDLDIPFEDEADAVAQITDAVAAGLEVDLDTNPALRDALQAAVADAYQTTLDEFTDRIAGTELADDLANDINIEVYDTVSTIDDRLTAMQRQYRRRRNAELRNAGFTWLDPLYFQRHDPGDPETAWRTGFDFADVEAEYPLPRERPASGERDERRRVTGEIRERLDDGENLVVLWDGGSGKSTTCKQVACEWHAADDCGPVFYRPSRTQTTFDEPGNVINY